MGWLNKYQQGGYSTTGYKADSPDRYNPYNIIPSGRITMQNVPHPVLGIDNFGNRQMMQSGGEYQFQGDQVFEVPAMKEGGIPQRYKTMGFTHVGQKKAGDGQHKWKVLAKKGDSYKVVQGGYRGMQDFKQHHSEERKDRFWDRMGGRDSSKAKDPFSPLYWHKRFGTWEYGGAVPSSEMYKDGGMIKRADGSYSQRGLWDNIRANAGSGKKPTKEMLQQEKKIRAAEKKEYGGWLDQYQGGGIAQTHPEYSIVDYLASQGQDYSKGHRAELAQQYGIQGYDYSAEKNLELLSKLKAATSLPQKPAGAPPVFTELMNWPETKPVPPVQVSKKQQTFNKDQARTVANKQAAFSNVRYQGEYMGQPTGRVSTPAPVHIPFADTQYQGEYQGQVMRTPVTRPDSFNVPNIIPVDVPYRKPADSNKQPIIKNTNFGNIKFNPNQGLDSGIVVDKQSNQAFIIKNHKVVHSFPVLTGSNPQDNPNLFSVDELEANKIGRTTPAGVYDISPNSSIYGKRGFDLYNPDLIKNVKIHTIYPGNYAARMQGLLSSDPEERRMSYGCINAQDCDIDQEYKYFPQGGRQLLHVLPVNQSKSINDYMTLPSQKYGGWLNEYQDGGWSPDQQASVSQMPTQGVSASSSPYYQTRTVTPLTYQQEFLKRMQENQGNSVIKEAATRRATMDKAGAIARNPITAAQYVVQGKPIPDYFEKGARNPYDYATDMFNPMTYVDAAKRTATLEHLRNMKGIQDLPGAAFNTAMDAGALIGLGSELRVRPTILPVESPTAYQAGELRIPVTYGESNVPPHYPYSSIEKVKYPSTWQGPARTTKTVPLTPENAPYLTEVTPLTKEQEILKSFGLNPNNPGKIEPLYMSTDVPKGDMYGQNQVLVQQSR